MLGFLKLRRPKFRCGGVFASRPLLAGVAIVLEAALVLGAGPLQAQTVLKFASVQAPNNAVVTQCLQPIVDGINKDAGSEFTVQLVNAPNLANLGNVWDRVADGVADIGFGIHGSSNLPFPKSTIAGLPLLLQSGKLDKGAVAMWHLYESGLIADEYKGVLPIALFATPVQVLSLRAPIKSLDELKGLKIRVADKTVSYIVTAFGASPISVPATETYQAVSQGVVAGSVANWVQLLVFRLSEVAKNHIEAVPLGSPAGFIVMNPGVPAKLSEKGRKILASHTGEPMSRAMGVCFNKLAEGLKGKLKSDATQNFIALDDAEKKRWENALAGVKDEWIKTTPDGAKIYDSFAKELAN